MSGTALTPCHTCASFVTHATEGLLLLRKTQSDPTVPILSMLMTACEMRQPPRKRWLFVVSLTSSLTQFVSCLPSHDERMRVDCIDIPHPSSDQTNTISLSSHPSSPLSLTPVKLWPNRPLQLSGGLPRGKSLGNAMKPSPGYCSWEQTLPEKLISGAYQLYNATWRQSLEVHCFRKRHRSAEIHF